MHSAVQKTTHTDGFQLSAIPVCLVSSSLCLLWIGLSKSTEAVTPDQGGSN